MSLRLTRIWLLPALLVMGDVWALGLGDIRLSSALNEPLRAEIELLSATEDELANLDIQLASAETFERYGLDRPVSLSSIQFSIVRSGRPDGNIVRVASTGPVTEPFITFLVEAVWSRGRLLREYTLLLDPPTFAPPPVAASNQAVTAPSRSTQADSGRIERAAPQQPSQAQPQRQATTRPAPSRTVTPPVASDAGQFDTTPGDDYRVQRGDTLWGIAQRVNPDNRLSTNQTMMAIFEANPQAFAGNINLLSAGAALRIPSPDEIIRINRGDALSEVQRQHAAWSGSAGAGQSRPSLVLVPPDGGQTAYDSGAGRAGAAGDAATQDRIRDLEREIAEQDSLLEIRDNELAALRDELARLRGEAIESLADDTTIDDTAVPDDLPADDELLVDDATDDLFTDDGVITDDAVVDDAIDDEPDVATDAPPRVVSSRPAEPGLVDQVLGLLSGFWGILIGGIIIVLALLVWFARRAGGDDDASGVWDALDADEMDQGSLTSTESLRAMERDDESAIVVVEQESALGGDQSMIDTLEAPASAAPMGEDAPEAIAEGDAGASLEDTFSSETAINLDQSDPVAEADFHMAYGLYDQAADLINGALAIEPERQDLLAKLCEIYFVWGNRDAFIDAASRMRGTVGANESNADWDKIVIMGQQIAGEHELFSGVSAGAATKAVDLSFEGGMEETGELDIDFAGEPASTGDDIIDLGAGDDAADFTETAGGDIDFMFEEPDTSASVTQEMPADEGTLAGPVDTGATAETPTIEQQFASFDTTGELPELADDDVTGLANLDEDRPSDETAEIELDDLGLDLDGLDEAGLSSDLQSEALLGDLEDTAESQILNVDADLDATGRNEILEEDDLTTTGRNQALAETAEVDELAATSEHEGFDIGDALDATGEMPMMADDATGRNPTLDLDDTAAGLDTSLLDATGMTQVLSDELAVDTASDVGALGDDDQTMLAPAADEGFISSEAETLLASMDDDDSTVLTEDSEFDFAKTEALPKEAFTDDVPTEDTGAMPGGLAGSTDMDLDLDDLTAALRVSEMGDTVDQPRDDATVQQPKIRERQDVDLDVGSDIVDGDSTPTERIDADAMSGDLHDARTMTEVGTKLDLARAYVDMGDPGGARSILEEVLDEGDESQRQQAQQLLDSLPA